jgi:hypothetical protein
LAITSPASGGRSVGIVRSRTQTMEFFFLYKYNNISGKLVLGNVLWLTSTVSSRPPVSEGAAVRGPHCVHSREASRTQIRCRGRRKRSMGWSCQNEAITVDECLSCCLLYFLCSAAHCLQQLILLT